MTGRRHKVRALRIVLAAGLLAAGMLLFASEAGAQRRGRGSVRHSSVRRTTVRRGGASKTTVRRTTRGGNATKRPTARRAATRRTGARRGGRGSVRHSSVRRTTVRRGGAGKTTVTTLRLGVPRRAARPGGPVRGGARAGYRAGGRDARYSAWTDARRDYHRFRTINHLGRVGASIAVLPRTRTTVAVSGTTYHYAGGVFYAPRGSGYVVASAPLGAVVHAVPTHTTVVHVDSTPYYYYGGTYYVETTEPAPQPTVVVDESNSEGTEAGVAPPIEPPMTDNEQSYKVVAPPEGATVPYLPDEADVETVGIKKYYVYQGTYYRPFSSEGDTVYVVLKAPRHSKGWSG